MQVLEINKYNNKVLIMIMKNLINISHIFVFSTQVRRAFIISCG